MLKSEMKKILLLGENESLLIQDEDQLEQKLNPIFAFGAIAGLISQEIARQAPAPIACPLMADKTGTPTFLRDKK